MAYDRTGTGAWAWLKSVGTQEEPLKPDWRVDDAHLLSSVWFSKHPRSIRGGDLLVYYAARHQVLPAIVEVVSDEVHSENDPRFKYRMDVRPIVTVGLRDAPALTEALANPQRVRRQSHILLDRREFQIARHFILEAASKTSDTVFEEPGKAAA
jgi:hypothetical protein